MSDQNTKPFVNKLGQTINVGDQVIAVTMSTKCLAVRKGVYIGQTSTGRVKVYAEFIEQACYYTDNNEPVKWGSTYDSKRPKEWRKEPRHRVTTLVNNQIFLTK